MTFTPTRRKIAWGAESMNSFSSCWVHSSIVRKSFAGDSNVLANAQSLPSFNHIYVEVSNKAGASFNDYGNNTYYMKFDNPGGGLNSLHITTDPRNLDGNITTTTSQKGTFYVDFTGGRNQDDFVLLVAVNGTIGSDFSLNLKSSVPT